MITISNMHLMLAALFFVLAVIFPEHLTLSLLICAYWVLSVVLAHELSDNPRAWGFTFVGMDAVLGIILLTIPNGTMFLKLAALASFMASFSGLAALYSPNWFYKYYNQLMAGFSAAQAVGIAAYISLNL